MADTIREQIIAAIAVKLADVRTANGYNTECGQNVQRAAKQIDPDDLPAVVMFPGHENVTRQYGVNTHVMPLRLEGLKDFGSSNASVAAEAVLGDLIKVMFRPTSLAEDVKYVSGGVEEYPDPGEKVVGVPAVFEVTYKTVAGDPYSQPS